MEREKLLYEKIYPAINAHRFHYNRLCSKKNIKWIVGEKKLKDSHHVVILSSNFQTKKKKANDSKRRANILHLSEKGKLFVSFIFRWKEKELEERAHFLNQLSTTAVIQTLDFYHINFNINGADGMPTGDKQIGGCFVNVHFVEREKPASNRICSSSSGDHQSVYIVTDIEIDANLLRPPNKKKGSSESNMRKLTHGASYHPTTSPMIEEVIDKLIEIFCALMKELLSDGYRTPKECVQRPTLRLYSE
ncbi:biotin protein ligase, putative [Plasmodium knowlesi strain H]|uniref:Biotin protein ligase, putative n=3 Tax=Plasmodium knowlesi TaxID=5850 RepID=A0A5K1V564_PLAKH|nr:biotin protein ligase, putative [Plasmodium knowlesi strain H]OTN65285.1 putative Biotin protein ligase [Plasmodium knowlesi]CAA9989546.1 biotin protein ligase, putative [Plasmodium knowlesi strain H]SBO22560.1 biotin protein ligase, putative [Plasmodium knowlesi strain H]SBO23555.1 biotin protein ligase, putative [Plasmodium knowlesi strain H]VVS79020.1 biotin protein ligase, putative [Plasmodium knowlesi strain H]|eukprot:XP_002260271.1 hypothetical protein, conserved in Plasmodium species [Plasmodium knowlesi strain H]